MAGLAMLFEDWQHVAVKSRRSGANAASEHKKENRPHMLSL
jgi:hypothetical protein